MAARAPLCPLLSTPCPAPLLYPRFSPPQPPSPPLPSQVCWSLVALDLGIAPLQGRSKTRIGPANRSKNDQYETSRVADGEQTAKTKLVSMQTFEHALVDRPSSGTAKVRSQRPTTLEAHALTCFFRCSSEWILGRRASASIIYR